MIRPAVNDGIIASLLAVIGTANAKRLLEQFVEKTTTGFATLDEMEAAKDLVALQREAHRLRGSTLMFGCTGLSEVLDCVERGGSWHEVRQASAKLLEDSVFHISKKIQSFEQDDGNI